MNKTYWLNDDWEFESTFTEDMLKADYDYKGEKIRLPHTVCETPFNYFDENVYQMVSGYRRKVRFMDEWEGKHVFLNIGAAAHYSEVYINGKMIMNHDCGYTSYKVELTSHLKKNEDNILCIKVDSRESLNQPPFGYVIDYMTYGGIYRDVSIVVKDSEYIEDIYQRAEIAKDAVLPGLIHDSRKMREKLPELIYEGTLENTITLANLDDDGCEYEVRQRVLAFEPGFNTPEYRQRLAESENIEDIEDIDDLNEVAYSRTTISPKDSDTFVFAFTTELDKVLLWDVCTPKLYVVVTELLKDEAVIDRRIDTAGFRKSEFKEDGYYLNGRKLKIRGLNRHQSYPYVGYAMPESQQRLDADILKYELGANAVRTSHYPQDPGFIDRCDEIGLLVFTEIPGWQHIGDENWKKTAIKNVSDMVYQYRNHPSIILWGVRINESPDDDELYIKTNQVAHDLDVSRPTGGVRCIKHSNLFEDVYTYNDFLHDGKEAGCSPKSDVTSDTEKPYLISEYCGHMYPTKAYDSEEHRLEQALRHVRVLDSVSSYKDICGSFAWCMFDYNTHKDFGSGDRICYHGVLDMFRNHKLAAYVYESQQTSHPVLAVSSSFDIGEHPASYVGDIYIFTNADSVRMYKKESGAPDFVFEKEYTRDPALFSHMKLAPILIDEYICEWGKASTVFKFEAIKNGKVVKTLIKSAVNDIKLSLDVSHENLVDGKSYDVSLVRICSVDENNNVLPFFNEPVSFKTEGDIELIGPAVTSLRGGMGGTYIRTKGNAGSGTLTVSSDRTEDITISFEIEKKPTFFSDN